MPVQQHVLNWLYSVLTSEYHDVNRTYNDVAHALARFPSLAPRTDVHTFTSGSSALLVHLAGTLPVTFRGSTYRFPISVWMPHAYPEQGPLIYVTPTDKMSIRPGQHVDPQGQVYHPYLVNWASNPQASSLVGFLDILADVFGREPPVVARQAVRPDAGPPYSATTQPPDQSFAQARPPPPPPKMAPQAPSDRSSLSTSETRGPPLPQLPLASTDEARNLSRYDSAPPLPRDAQSPTASGTRLLSNRQPYDMQDARRLSNHSGYNPQGGLSSGGTAVPPPQIHGRHPGPSQHPGLGQPPHMVSQAQQQFPPSHTWHHPEKRPTQKLRSQASEHPPLQRPPRAPADLMDEPLELSIPDSSSVAPPPIPPNPEKDALLRQLAHTLAALRQHSRQQNDSSLSGLQAQRKAMLAVLPTMENEMNQLTHLSSVLSSNASILRESLRKADGVIEGSRSHPTPSIDELLVAPTVVANQLYTLVAEERALGDSIFMLGRAVERGRVSPAVFAKMTRSLAREWYLKKALVRKIGLGMGLAP